MGQVFSFLRGRGTFYKLNGKWDRLFPGKCFIPLRFSNIYLQASNGRWTHQEELECDYVALEPAEVLQYYMAKKIKNNYLKPKLLEIVYALLNHCKEIDPMMIMHFL